MEKPPDFNEQVFVGAILADTNAKTSTIIDTFSGWLTAGFAGASALLISQYDSLSKHLPPNAIRSFLLFFCWALALGIIEKYFYVLVQSHSEGNSIGRNLGDKAAEKSITLDFEKVFPLLESAIFRPGRWFVSRNIQNLKEGHIASSSIFYTKIAQVQNLFAFMQAILILIAIYKIASAFHA